MSNSGDDLLAQLDAAISSEDSRAVQTWFLSQQFFLIVLASDEDDDAFSALIVEGDEFASIVVFLDQERAESFVEFISNQLEGEQVELLSVDGETLLDPLTDDIGIVLNPEEDDMVTVPPNLLVRQASHDAEVD